MSYYGRTYEEGKKISWKDGVRAVYVIVKYGLLSIVTGRSRQEARIEEQG